MLIELGYENITVRTGDGYIGWGEKLDENNIGLLDHSLLTPIDTLHTIEAGVPIAVNISDIMSSNGVHSFALGVVNLTDHVTFLCHLL